MPAICTRIRTGVRKSGNCTKRRKFYPNLLQWLVVVRRVCFIANGESTGIDPALLVVEELYCYTFLVSPHMYSYSYVCMHTACMCLSKHPLLNACGED